MVEGRRYADQPRRRGFNPWWLFALAVVILAIPAAIWSWNRHLEKAAAEVREWTITGPPCPELTRQAYLARPRRADQEVQLGDFTFGRADGNVSCNFIAYDGGRGLGDYPVCQFNGPGVLHVITPKGESYFFANSGPATVSVPHGRPQCVLAAKFRGAG